MSADLHQRAKPIFLAASQLSSEQARVFLDQACGGDVELRREVESLLANHQSATLFGQREESDTAIDAPATSAAFDTTSGQRSDRDERAVGTIVTGRYRLLGLLGRGGMGTVYRAADLELDEDIAIKFIHGSAAGGEALARRARDEVRLARLVTHPNVTRIHDIGEDNGQAYITMEFVGGEDLKTLLRRVGRLSSEKTIDVARQLCFGLGAAHEKGVLHRDLKPANVMLDATGQVRIMDFGIAIFSSDVGRLAELAGTPFYMAPELFGGDAPSVQSDLYALGLVLYEAVTATPFAGPRDDTFTSILNQDAAIRGVNASLVMAIDRCLQAALRQRPGSAYEVAGILPGGDPIAAAMRQGDAPSPSLIVAAGDRRGLSASKAFVLWGACLFGLAVVLLLADRTFLFSQSSLPKEPAVLRDRAEAIVERLGYRRDPATARDGLEWANRRWARSSDETVAGEPQGMPFEPVISYWYRAGDARWREPPLVGRRSRLNPRPPSQGVLTITLDPIGELREFTAFGCEQRFAKADAGIDWAEIFSVAGLDYAKCESTEGTDRMAHGDDGAFAWAGKDSSGKRSVVVRASVGGGVLRSFTIEKPDAVNGDTSNDDAVESGNTPSISFVLSGLYVALTAVAALMVRHNLRRGRIDGPGAWRVTTAVGCSSMLAWVLESRHVWIGDAALTSFWQWASWSCAFAAMVGVWYAAIEFYARKLWPHRLTAWSRVLRGEVRDAAVGRGVLLGVTTGVLLVLLLQVDVLSAQAIDPARPFAVLPRGDIMLSEFLGFRRELGIVLRAMLDAVVLSMGVLLLSLVARVLLRNERRATLATWIALSLLLTLAAYEERPFPLLSGMPRAAAIMLIVTRVGLLATVVSFFTTEVILASPLTLDSSAWYAAHGAFALAIVAVLATWAWRTSIGNRRLLGQSLLDL